jgi:hypothetical protein
MALLTILDQNENIQKDIYINGKRITSKTVEVEDFFHLIVKEVNVSESQNEVEEWKRKSIEQIGSIGKVVSGEEIDSPTIAYWEGDVLLEEDATLTLEYHKQSTVHLFTLGIQPGSFSKIKSCSITSQDQKKNWLKPNLFFLIPFTLLLLVGIVINSISLVNEDDSFTKVIQVIFLLLCFCALGFVWIKFAIRLKSNTTVDSERLKTLGDKKRKTLEIVVTIANWIYILSGICSIILSFFQYNISVCFSSILFIVCKIISINVKEDYEVEKKSLSLLTWFLFGINIIMTIVCVLGGVK